MDLSYLTLQNSDISPFLSALPPALLDVCRPVRFPKDAVVVERDAPVDRGVYGLRDRGYLTLQKGKIHISAGQYRRLLSDWWKSDTPPDQVHPAEVP